MYSPLGQTEGGEGGGRFSEGRLPEKEGAW